MRQSAGKGRRAWFWVGVVLISLSALFWLLLIPAIVKNPNLGGIILFIFLTALPIGIGIYGIRRGRRWPVVGDVSKQIFAEEDTETLVQQQERRNAVHVAERYNRAGIVRGASASIEKRMEGLPIGFALATGFVLWHSFLLEIWQTLLIVAALIAVSFIYSRWHLGLIFWTVVSPLLLVITYISIFWIVAGPETIARVEIVSKELEVRTSYQSGTSTTHYVIRAIDDYGHRYKVYVYRPQWESLSEGDNTSITYHYEKVAGLYLQRRVETKLGQETIAYGGGRFGSAGEVINTMMDMGASALPFVILVWLWVKSLNKEVKRLSR